MKLLVIFNLMIFCRGGEYFFLDFDLEIGRVFNDLVRGRYDRYRFIDRSLDF